MAEVQVKEDSGKGGKVGFEKTEYPCRYDADGRLRFSFDYFLYVYHHI